uniref:Glutathione S-transferase T3-like n=1 Tax=Tanacetum cinerariifolium TaxID=118510 RepID=A0A6L2KFZ5_TANCI|nr:hypothetical protein [Tanacetum cinerariifolium]
MNHNGTSVNTKLSQLVEGDSPVEEVVAMKPKRKYTKRRQPIKKSDKEFVEPWTNEDEVALCKAWVSASENSIEGNGKRASRFWTEVIEYFHNGMGESKEPTIRLNANRKIGFVLRLVNFVRFTIMSKIGTKVRHVTLLSIKKPKLSIVVAPMGRNMAKKKSSSSGARSKTSVAGDHSLVDALLSKFTIAASPVFSQRKESSSE